MDDEIALLSAIAAAPSDRAPRLVYADWLDEHGQADRAEYLRLFDRTGEPAAMDRIRELAPALDPAWVARVTPDYPAVPPLYVVVRVLAHGDLTTIYEAACTLPALRDRRVVLRLLNRRQAIQRFMYACQIEAALGEIEHVPPLYEVGEYGECAYSVRMFVDGDTLHNNIRARVMTPAEVVRVAMEVAAVLDAAHLRGIVHGQVHPRHLLLGRDGNLWLIGFGEMNPPAQFSGNPLHLAPEQLDAAVGPIGPQTDVYQLAESAAWLIGGRHPFQDHLGVQELLAAKRRPDAWRTGALRDLPGILTRVFRRALCPDPERRYPTPGELAAALAVGFERRSWWRLW